MNEGNNRDGKPLHQGPRIFAWMRLQASVIS